FQQLDTASARLAAGQRARYRALTTAYHNRSGLMEMHTGASGAAAVGRLMRPRSVAIIGISSKAGSAGQTVLETLKLNNFKGDIHLVGRASEIDGRPVRQSADELPEDIDLAIFSLPAAGVKEALAACVRRKMKAAVVFSSGFAEVSEEMRPAQDELSAMARAGDLALLGPNCLGYTNYVDGFTAGFAHAAVVPRVASERDPALAGVFQSRGVLGHLRQGV